MGNTFKNGCIDEGAFCRDALSGTAVSCVEGCRRRRPSYEKKENVLPLRRGPPSTPPKSFCRSLAFGSDGLMVRVGRIPELGKVTEACLKQIGIETVWDLREVEVGYLAFS